MTDSPGPTLGAPPADPRRIRRLRGLALLSILLLGVISASRALPELLLFACPFWLPYLLLWRRSPEGQKRALGWAVVAGGGGLLITVAAAVIAVLPDGRSSPGMEAQASDYVAPFALLLLILSQAALVWSAIKTFQAARQQPGEKLAIGWPVVSVIFWVLLIVFFPRLPWFAPRRTKRSFRDVRVAYPEHCADCLRGYLQIRFCRHLNKAWPGDRHGAGRQPCRPGRPAPLGRRGRWDQHRLRQSWLQVRLHSGRNRCRWADCRLHDHCASHRIQAERPEELFHRSERRDSCYQRKPRRNRAGRRLAVAERKGVSLKWAVFGEVRISHGPIWRVMRWQQALARPAQQETGQFTLS